MSQVFRNGTFISHMLEARLARRTKTGRPGMLTTPRNASGLNTDVCLMQIPPQKVWFEFLRWR